MARSTIFLIALFVLHLSYGSQAQPGFDQQSMGQPFSSMRRLGYRSQCQLERLTALEPTRRVPSEAGFTEYFDQNNEQLQCAAVTAHRRTIMPRGLLLPSFSSAPSLVYILQGKGMMGMVMPGCPETYQSFRQTEQQMGEEASQSQRFRDEHQRIHYFREGDVIAMPAGVAHWCYNYGEVPVVAVTVTDIGSNANQLDRTHREFLLAGKERQAQQPFEPEQREQQRMGKNLLMGFDRELLAQALGVDPELVKRMQNLDDNRGEIVRVERGLQVLHPSQTREEQTQQQQQEEKQEGQRCERNGLDETFCTMKARQNMAVTTLADYYNPRAGTMTTLNSQKLPILRFIQMSAERGVLRRDALTAPYWNINAHSIKYVVRGSCRMQVVGPHGRTVFDGELRQGQLIVIPQHYMAMKKAQSESFEWVAFKTNDNAMVSHVVGKTSALRGMPVEVLMNSYRVSREEAMRLKFNRGNEIGLFAPRFTREAAVASQ
ncbi:cocosin 1-like [Zingiber officinale]|uniref:cocosin 1-like n=1 Tax=Zingiber officinale TaxID=94328 RepID=UPI001C4AA3D7|nr:cocosin 1-like [Zingiber officinale]